jgi:beta-phosphoglucomutase-like phosphatase (HAD superfamily)
VAVEDSEPGVRAARAAGMRVVAVARRAEDAGPLGAAGGAVVSRVDAAELQSLLEP